MALATVLQNIANAIKSKTGSNERIVANNFATEITNKLQKKASGTKSITANGTSDVTNYASVSVNVPIPSGYIKPSGTKSITSNGTNIDVNAYQYATVAVPASAVTSGNKSITTNGTHNVTTYKNAVVNVPASAVCSGSVNITTNGTHSVVGKASAVVNVPIPSGYIKVEGIEEITKNGQYDISDFEFVNVNVSTSLSSLNLTLSDYSGQGDTEATYIDSKGVCQTISGIDGDVKITVLANSILSIRYLAVRDYDASGCSDEEGCLIHCSDNYEYAYVNVGTYTGNVIYLYG